MCVYIYNIYCLFLCACYSLVHIFTVCSCQQLAIKYLHTKVSIKNGGMCRDIKTKKAQEQDWDGTLATKLNITST